MIDRTLINNRINREMNEWRRGNYSEVMDNLARMCGCNIKYISCLEIFPDSKPGYDAGYVFFGPKDTVLGEIRWDKNGRGTDFYLYEDNVVKIHDYIARRRAQRAKEKSVNKSREQAQSRAVSFRKGLDELAYVAKRNVKELVMVGAVVAMLATSAVVIKNTVTRDYINNDYTAGYQAVTVETHRTQGNDGYWYDYNDIAGHYDEGMDFDSFVYGAYSNLGWNQQSRIDCMNDLFRQLHLDGVTEFNSFVAYCDALGLCNTKGDDLIVDTRAFSKYMEKYMKDYNDSLEVVSNNEKSGPRM